MYINSPAAFISSVTASTNFSSNWCGSPDRPDEEPPPAGGDGDGDVVAGGVPVPPPPLLDGGAGVSVDGGEPVSPPPLFEGAAGVSVDGGELVLPPPLPDGVDGDSELPPPDGDAGVLVLPPVDGGWLPALPPLSPPAQAEIAKIIETIKKTQIPLRAFIILTYPYIQS